MRPEWVWADNKLNTSGMSTQLFYSIPCEYLVQPFSRVLIHPMLRVPKCVISARRWSSVGGCTLYQ